MVNDTKENAVDLYDQCFNTDRNIIVETVDPKVMFARVLRQIDTMDLKQRARVDVETRFERGYVFAIHELESDYVTIGYGGKVRLTSTFARLQIANPRKLEIIAVLQRYSYDDARALCEMMHNGMMMYQAKSRTWFHMENCRQKVIAMFARIDKIQAPSQPDKPPKLVRQQSIFLDKFENESS